MSGRSSFNAEFNTNQQMLFGNFLTDMDWYFCFRRAKYNLYLSESCQIAHLLYSSAYE